MASSLNSEFAANNSNGTGLVPISENHFVPLRANLLLPIIIGIGKKGGNFWDVRWFDSHGRP